MPARDDLDRIECATGIKVGSESVVSEEPSVLSVAEEPREIFAIGLVYARARARAVIHREPVAQRRAETADESPRTRGVLEREASVAARTGDSDNGILLEMVL